MRKVYGVGINDSNYRVSIKEYIEGKRVTVWSCPFYKKWVSMLARCYSEEFQKNNPKYQGCTADDDWHLFSKFKAWMESQDWHSKDLDKDLIFYGNKFYSPSTCFFLPKHINTFMLECDSARGIWPIGASFNKDEGKFLSRCQDVETKKVKHLGWFDTADEAHKAWLSFKQKQAVILASKQKNLTIANLLISRYENYGGRQCE